MASIMRCERGQLLLIGALVLSVTFVALGLIVNSAIFAENLASRGDTTGAENVGEYHDALDRGVGTLIEYENHNVSDSDGQSAISDRLDIAINDLQSTLTRHQARIGSSANASVRKYAGGSRIFQDDIRTFTNSSGDGTWQLATDTSRTRAFRLNISQANTSNASTCGGLFANCSAIRLANASAEWKVSIAKDSSGAVVVGVDNGGGTETCSPIDQPFVEVDLTAGTVDGEGCPALSFGDAPSSGYDITYENGSELGGSYSLVVNKTAIADTPPSDYAAGPQPAVRPVIYAVTLDYHYQTSEVYMTSRIESAPGEYDG